MLEGIWRQLGFAVVVAPLILLLALPSLAGNPSPQPPDSVASNQTQAFRERLLAFRKSGAVSSLSFLNRYPESVSYRSLFMVPGRGCSFDVSGQLSELIDILLAADLRVGYPPGWEAMQTPESGFAVFIDTNMPQQINLWFANPMHLSDEPLIAIGQAYDTGQVVAYKITAEGKVRDDLLLWARLHGTQDEEMAAYCKELMKYDPPIPAKPENRVDLMSLVPETPKQFPATLLGVIANTLYVVAHDLPRRPDFYQEVSLQRFLGARRAGCSVKDGTFAEQLLLEACLCPLVATIDSPTPATFSGTGSGLTVQRRRSYGPTKLDVDTTGRVFQAIDIVVDDSVKNRPTYGEIEKLVHGEWSPMLGSNTGPANGVAHANATMELLFKVGEANGSFTFDFDRTGRLRSMRESSDPNTKWRHSSFISSGEAT